MLLLTFLKTFYKLEQFKECVGFFFFNNLIATNAVRIYAVQIRGWQIRAFSLDVCRTRKDGLFKNSARAVSRIAVNPMFHDASTQTRQDNNYKLK